MGSTSFKLGVWVLGFPLLSACGIVGESSSSASSLVSTGGSSAILDSGLHPQPTKPNNQAEAGRSSVGPNAIPDAGGGQPPADGAASDASDGQLPCEAGASTTPDSDCDGIPDAKDLCPNDPSKADPGLCGCGTHETVYGPLETDASKWAVYLEGTASNEPPRTVYDPIQGRDVLVCTLKDAASYSNAHFYTNLTPNVRASRFRLDAKVRTPETSINNAGVPSVVQGVELSMSTWRLGRRYESAIQLDNVGDGSPMLRYWDPSREPVDRWVATNEHPSLTPGWHDVTLEAQVVTDRVHYQQLTFDGVPHPFTVADVQPACDAGVPDKLAFAVQLDGNAAGSTYDVALSGVKLTVCEDASAFETQAPTFTVDRCGQGVPLDLLENVTACDTGAGNPGAGRIQCFNATGSNVTIASGSGCHNEPQSALALHYSLVASPNADWVSIRKQLSTPLDLSGAAYLLFPFKGESGGLARTIEIKLEDTNGCRTSDIITAASDLPVWRTTVISLSQFSRPGQSTCGGNIATDLSRISTFEIGISELGNDVPSPEAAASGTLLIDDITFVDAAALQGGTDHYECAVRDDVTITDIADSLLARQTPDTGLVPTWYEESPPTYNTYAQSLALTVLSLEYSRTGNARLATAATRLADTLTRLQLSDGSWVTNLDPETTLNAANVADIWVGNVSWAMLAQRTFINEVRPANAASYEASIEAAHGFLLGRIAEFEQETGLVGGITTGTEGNVSTFFGLRVAGDIAAANQVAQFLLDNAWDAKQGHFRMGIDYDGLALDVIGGWGVDLLRKIGRNDLARKSLGTAAEIFAAQSWSGTLTGLGDIAGPWQPTTEFTCQYASAGGPGANWLVRQLVTLQVRPGEFRAAPDPFAGGDGWNTEMSGVAPSAWIYLALRGGLLQGF